MSKNPSTSDLLSTLADSLTSSLSSLPDASAICPPPSSFSLLSTKNELFLSYLQNLTFLIILNLRKLSARTGITGKNEKEPPNRQANGNTVAAHDDGQKRSSSDPDLRDTVIENLTGVRVYLEKGVHPLEGRLKYQLDKLLLAAADHARENASADHDSNSRDHQITGSRGSVKDSKKSSTGISSVLSAAAAAAADDDNHEEESNARISSIPPLAHRPNPSALIRPTSSTNPAQSTSKSTKPTTTAPYRPPRINPTLPPPTDSTSTSTSKRGPRRSRAMDAFIREEMDDAPMAEMSIGAGRGGGIAALEGGGKQAERERERREWEETRLVRLPDDKKQKKKRRRDAGEGEGEGEREDWGLMMGDHDHDDDHRGGGRGKGERKKRKKEKSGKAKAKAKGKGKSMKRT